MGTLGKQELFWEAALRNLSELKESPESPYDQRMLTYIKILATYGLDLAATFLDFACDAEVSSLVLKKYLDRLHMQTEVAHVSLG